MLVEQAIFSSARTKRHQGYQLIAQSSSLPDRIADFLAKWGPTHGSLLSTHVHADSVNFTPIGSDWVALSRTLYGGPEYSSRGALQVVTRFLVLRRNQLVGYDYNPVSAARTARLLGHLQLPGNVSAALAAVDLPECRPRFLGSQAAATSSVLISRSLEMMRSQRLALIGAEDPLATIDRIICGTPRQDRLDISFTTGLVPSQHRQFRIHMLSQMDQSMHDRLSHQDIRFLAASL